MSIYQDIILDHYRSPRNFGHLKKYNIKTAVSNPLCGDKIHLELLIQGGKIIDISFSGEGCAISTASASLLTEEIKGKKVDEAKTMRKEQVIDLLGVELSPNRLRCGLLSLEAVHQALQSSQEV